MNNKFISIKCSDCIVLSQLKSSDAICIFDTINSQREYLGKWLPFIESTKELKDSESFVDHAINIPYENLSPTFIIKYNDEFAGLIGLKDSDISNKRTEIGYWLSEPFQNKGIMTKSVRCLIEYAFNELDFNRIQIKVAVENERSSNIPKKLGFTFEGIERSGERFSDDKYLDIEVYSLLKKDNR